MKNKLNKIITMLGILMSIMLIFISLSTFMNSVDLLMLMLLVYGSLSLINFYNEYVKKD